MRRFRRALAWAAPLALAAACSVTGTMSGGMEDGSDSFSGTVTGFMDGSGTLTATSRSGLDCTGTWLFTTGRKGRGTFRCSDGRSGPFEFVSTGSHGTGTGRLGDKRFTFTFTR